MSLQPFKPTPSPLTAFLALNAGVSVLALAILASPACGQSVVKRVLLTNDGPVRAASLPSLHDGVFAGFGYRQNFSSVIYAGRLADPTNAPPHIVVADGDVVPNHPGGFFGSFQFPTVWNGNVYFTGKASSASPDPPDGLYAGTIGVPGLSVVSDTLNGNGPWIHARPFAGALGIAYKAAAVATGTGAGISLWTYDRQWINLVSYDQPLADGTQVSSTRFSDVAYGEHLIVYSMLAGFPDLNASGHGIFAYDTTTGATTRVASMATSIPGDGRLMELVAAPDTDGSLVAFAASSGHLFFGGTAAVCVANPDGSDLRTIARTGQPMPGAPGRTYFEIGRVAVDDGIVWFNASYRDGGNTRLNLFAHILATDTTLPVILYTDTINGVAGNSPWFRPQGVDGRDAVIECEAPTGNMGVSIFTLVHAHITSTCDPDINCDGVPDQDDVACIILAVAGDMGCFCQTDPDFNRDGVPDQGDVADLILAVAGAPCP